MAESRSQWVAWVLGGVTCVGLVALFTASLLETRERKRETNAEQRGWRASQGRQHSQPRICEHLDSVGGNEVLGVFPRKAPIFTLKNKNNQPVSLSSFGGKKVLLHFWASWCKPCLEELPALEALAVNMPDVQLIAISVDERWEEALRVLPQNPHFEVLLDPAKEIANQYGTQGFPETFLINASGEVVEQYKGAQPLWEDERTIVCLKK